jgi:carbon storage regulator
MLVLSRAENESICICGHEITITVVEIRGDKVRIGIKADRDRYPVHRHEVQAAIDRQNSADLAG